MLAPLMTIGDGIARLDTWAASHRGCRVRRHGSLTDAKIDEAFAQISPHYGSFEARPNGEYREFLRRYGGLTIEVDVGGESIPIDDYQFRVFDPVTVAMAQREVVFFTSPEFESGVGKNRQTRWLSRNHLLAFAGERYAPDVLWVFDVSGSGDGDWPIHLLDQDPAYGAPSLMKNRDGLWNDRAPTPETTSFASWLLAFADGLGDVDPFDYV